MTKAWTTVLFLCSILMNGSQLFAYQHSERNSAQSHQTCESQIQQWPDAYSMSCLKTAMCEQGYGPQVSGEVCAYVSNICFQEMSDDTGYSLKLSAKKCRRVDDPCYISRRSSGYSASSSAKYCSY